MIPSPSLLKPPIDPPPFGEAHLHRLLSPAHSKGSQSQVENHPPPSSPVGLPLNVLEQNLMPAVKMENSVATTPPQQCLMADASLKSPPVLTLPMRKVSPLSNSPPTQHTNPLSNMEPIADQLRRITSFQHDLQETNTESSFTHHGW